MHITPQKSRELFVIGTALLLLGLVLIPSVLVFIAG
jgi:hypothetical protein